ncbi:MAG: P1 family peptidase, partial [Saprospiraceae bacterium]|nr:P1 family peptidase [Saprospiraceae bacterium]
TFNVGTAIQAVIDYTLQQPENSDVRSVNAVVGETNDGRLNDIRGMHVKSSDVWHAIRDAQAGKVEEGSVGAGTGTIAFGYKGGIGTASRKLPEDLGGYTVGVLVQANFGGVLNVAGAPVGVWLDNYPYRQQIENADGSCMMVVATDAPLDSRNLKRLAKRAMLGLARTGGYASNGSGDYVIAFSNYKENRESYLNNSPTQVKINLVNDAVSPLFLAVVESTEEAILNALFASKLPQGFENKGISAFPVDEVIKLMKSKGNLDRK